MRTLKCRVRQKTPRVTVQRVAELFSNQISLISSSSSSSSSSINHLHLHRHHL